MSIAEYYQDYPQALADLQILADSLGEQSEPEAITYCIEACFQSRDFPRSTRLQGLLDSMGFEFLARGDTFGYGCDRAGYCRQGSRLIFEIVDSRFNYRREDPLPALMQAKTCSEKAMMHRQQLSKQAALEAEKRKTLPCDRDAAEQLAELRREARVRKDWVESDRLRNDLKTIGYKIVDTKDGSYHLTKERQDG